LAHLVKLGLVAEGQISDLDHEGRGVTRASGKAVFVSGALPGERVRYAVQRRKRHYDEADLIEVLEPSPQRQLPRCRHFGVCGGCSLQHLQSEAQIAGKQHRLLEDLNRIGHLTPRAVIAPLTGPIWGYRRRARLGVKYVFKKGKVLVGFRERAAPYLADVQRCEVLAEPWQDLPARLATLIDSLSVRERIPQVEFAASLGGTALVFRVLDPPSPEDAAKLAEFGRVLGVVIYLQSAGPDSVQPLAPPAAPLCYELAGGAERLQLQFEPTDFVQVNAVLNEQMVAAVLRELGPQPGEQVLDLFCGLGNFSLPLASTGAQVTGVEGDARLVARAAANAERNACQNLRFYTADLCKPEEFGDWARARYDAVLLDPPRAGAKEIAERMSQWGPQRVVYISCHTGTLARDAGILAAGGAYELVGAGVMDMFPHTTHVESIAVFERRF
jgi:23S rRNA (uracil1939-C5)-methyltransferase